jgi:hypothetical protein
LSDLSVFTAWISIWEQDRRAETHDPCQLGAGERDDPTGAGAIEQAETRGYVSADETRFDVTGQSDDQ